MLLSLRAGVVSEMLMAPLLRAPAAAVAGPKGVLEAEGIKGELRPRCLLFTLKARMQRPLLEAIRRVEEEQKWGRGGGGPCTPLAPPPPLCPWQKSPSASSQNAARVEP